MIAAVRLPHLANFDDLDPLAAEPDVHVRWTARVEGLEGSAAIVIPGTRNTLADLRWLWETGLAAAIRAHQRAGVAVVGLCGGYQIMGMHVTDPGGIEAGGECLGLGLLDTETMLAPTKATRRVRAAVLDATGPIGLPLGATVDGYEIHHGRTRIGPEARNWIAVNGEPVGAWAWKSARVGSRARRDPRLSRAAKDTACAAGEKAHAAAQELTVVPAPTPAWGAYLHGLFHNDALRDTWLASLRAVPAGLSWEARVEREIDRVADVVEHHVDAVWLDRLLRHDAGHA